ncbi:MAG: beta-lactamase family protein [Bacteroidetes Order II. Incertae sedis bacterium]|nr:beta-lactamase family protein [Bacteroidetes Order II. bacterium]
MKANFERLDKHIRHNNLFNGNLLVALNEEVIYQGSFGFTNNSKQNNLINSNTIFELASVSKQFTAYAALFAFKTARENIDNDIRVFIPNFPYENITTRNLLNHTSGLPDYFQLLDENWDKNKIACNKDVLDLIVKVNPKIHFSPNEKWEYSNTGYVLLASLIEIISGTSFAEFIDENIFKPITMQNSFVYNRRLKPKKINNYAYGIVYNEAKNIFELPDNISDFNDVFYLDGIQGDGTINSTISDLLKWNNEILNKSILDRNLVDIMLSNTQILNNEKVEYGMGWIINDDAKLGKIVYHGGSWPGYSTYNSIYLDEGYSIVSLCNQPKNLEIEQQIIIAMENILFDKPFELPNNE